MSAKEYLDFQNGAELLEFCEAHSLPISEVMRQRELRMGQQSEEALTDKWRQVLEIMKAATHDPIANPKKSMGGLIGGEAKKIRDHEKNQGSVCGTVLSKAIAYSMAVLEVNASMGLIVAAPTAGSSGVLPGVLMSLMEEFDLEDRKFYDGLSNASAIGYLLMQNASISGAEAGCQAEVGAASAMAASAVTEIMGGTPGMCMQAASLALSNLLGLVCDPIAGLVEVPCQSRNAIGAANALTSAELALSGIEHPVPFDEMAAAMLKTGRALPAALRETAIGGNAGTPAGCRIAGCIYGGCEK